MMVSTRGRYALRIMIDLAQNESDRYVPLKEVAQRQEISEKYMEGIIASLSRGGLVSGLRGKGGGYRLSRAPKEYKISEILQLTEGSMAPVQCLECEPVRCSRAAECKTLPMWKKLHRVIDDFFDNITLEDLVNGNIEENLS